MRTGPTIVAGSIEPIVDFATAVKAHKLEREIGTAAGTARLTENLHPQELPNSVAPTCEPAQYVIPRLSLGRAQTLVP
jgi:hypothetical protein